MPLHWTYQPFEPGSDLEQGDLVLRSGDLDATLRRVHPYFSDARYIGFLVTTQTCDLVRRSNSNPKARHINIAALRPLRSVLDQLLSAVCQQVCIGVYRSSAAGDARRFLERLFNQNEQALGLFYLHEDRRAGVGESSVAFLRVSIALRAEHYDDLVNARCGRLRPEFQAKLGWLVGNLYARPAAPDWNNDEECARQLEDLIREHLEEQSPEAGPHWVEDRLIDAGIEAGVDLEGKTWPQIREGLENHRPEEIIEQAIQQVEKDIRRYFGRPGLNECPEFVDELVKKVGNRLRNNGVFKSLLRK